LGALTAEREAKMAEIEAVPAELIRVSVSGDGQHALFEFRGQSGPFTLAIAEPELMHLMALASQASGQAQKIRQSDPAMKHDLPCEWWSFDRHPDGQHMILSFRVPGGMELSFQVHLERAPQMIETLQTISGAPTTAPDDRSRH
jgi:hypothetical protein